MTIQAVNTVYGRVNTNKTSFTSEPKAQEEKSNGKALLLGSLAVLAIGGGIYLATRGKSKGSTSTASQTTSTAETPSVKSLEEKIAKLKGEIRGKFVEARDTYWGNRDNLGGAPLIVTNDLGLPNFAFSTKQADEVLTRLRNDKNVADARKVLDEFSKSARSRLAELSNDADWVEMRRLRKQLIKGNQAEVTARLNENGNGQRLYLINEILFAKVNGKSKLLEALGMSVDDAIKMVKAPEIPQLKLDTGLHNLRAMRDVNQMMSPLTKHHFGNFNNIDTARFTIRQNQRQIRHTLEWKEKFPERLKTFRDTVLADFRQSDDVKQLKQLTAELKQARAEK